jgi:hypothetical protein
MIYEMRTDRFHSNAHTDEFERKFSELIAYRDCFSVHGAFWKVIIGPINQVIHIWPYESIQNREQVRAAVHKDGKWPPKNVRGMASLDVEILTPAPFMRPWGQSQKLGNIYEVRTYYLKAGCIADMIKRWGECIPFREKLSPLAACWHTDIGVQHRWISVWPFQSLDERKKIRDEALKNPKWHWPPPTQDLILRQEIKIMVPAPFSTMR